MSQVLLIDKDPVTLTRCATDLRRVGYKVLAASSGSEGLEFLSGHTIDVVITTLASPDESGLNIVRTLFSHRSAAAFVVVTGSGTREAVAAMCRDAAAGRVTPAVDHARAVVAPASPPLDRRASVAPPRREPQEAHALMRWATAIVPIVESPRDPRTIAGWASWVAASPGTLRNWCRTARIGARRSLVFGRMLRAVLLGEEGRHRPENLLDIVDRRTLLGLLRYAGFKGERDLPTRVPEFLERQMLVRDAEALLAVARALDARGQPARTRGAADTCPKKPSLPCQTS
jgi:CheY-like chemotaxis protein